jgi:hypothetical protein
MMPFFIMLLWHDVKQMAICLCDHLLSPEISFCDCSSQYFNHALLVTLPLWHIMTLKSFVDRVLANALGLMQSNEFLCAICTLELWTTHNQCAA